MQRSAERIDKWHVETGKEGASRDGPESPRSTALLLARTWPHTAPSQLTRAQSLTLVPKCSRRNPSRLDATCRATKCNNAPGRLSLRARSPSLFSDSPEPSRYRHTVHREIPRLRATAVAEPSSGSARAPPPDSASVTLPRTCATTPAPPRSARASARGIRSRPRASEAIRAMSRSLRGRCYRAVLARSAKCHDRGTPSRTPSPGLSTKQQEDPSREVGPFVISPFRPAAHDAPAIPRTSD